MIEESIHEAEYIHNNPVKWKLCTYPEEYKWSSAKFYWEGIDDFNMLTHLVSVGEDTNR
jgi:spore coat polysaccharide biosynthesis protein SpsF (cytidylyltransferase family)